MASWEGGLPPAAHARIARQRASGVAGSLLSAPGAAAIRSVALQPVGEVFGSLVMQLSWSGGGCGIWNANFRPGGVASFPFGDGTAAAGSLGGIFGGGGPIGQGGAFGANPFGRGPAVGGWPGNAGGYWTTPVLTTGGRGGRNAGFGSYVHAFAHAWHGAHDRMAAEAAALGADGVVGVSIRRTLLENATWEFTAVGTAVRSLDTSITPSGRGGVWTAGFSAEHVTALVQSGYVPRGMALGLSVSTKHEDGLLKQQRSVWTDNTEVNGLTELLEAARDDARAQLTARAAPLGATDLVVTDSSVGEFETPCGDEVDLHAEALFVGTAIAPGPMHAFRNHSSTARAQRDVLGILPLTDPGVRSAQRYR
ncbi:heavy metal-binding domain-containing protein [Curtobacterium ammoniigenes]|uniref:heavy metal-binding domain-containing protein n=1 Tax=Curtobacterium ammoniigenes TaxID=395387 RepID=UPI00082D556C|nr:heavy metal-binding domain-containing protein [Curtobacterium ammoniigenes]